MMRQGDARLCCGEDMLLSVTSSRLTRSRSWQSFQGEIIIKCSYFSLRSKPVSLIPPTPRVYSVFHLLYVVILLRDHDLEHLDIEISDRPMTKWERLIENASTFQNRVIVSPGNLDSFVPFQFTARILQRFRWKTFSAHVVHAIFHMTLNTLQHT